MCFYRTTLFTVFLTADSLCESWNSGRLEDSPEKAQSLEIAIGLKTNRMLGSNISTRRRVLCGYINTHCACLQCLSQVATSLTELVRSFLQKKGFFNGGPHATKGQGEQPLGRDNEKRVIIEPGENYTSQSMFRELK